MYAKSFGEITLPSVVLTTDAARLGFDNLSSVTTDDVEAAECAMEYLLESGHRRIGVIAGDLSCSARRGFAMRAACSRWSAAG